MDPTASFVVAIIAIVVAVPSAVASIWALVQTAKYAQRSRLELEWPRVVTSFEDNIARVTVDLLNYGNAPARDVRVQVDHVPAATPDARWIHWRAIEAGEVKSFWVPLETIKLGPNGKDWAPVAELGGRVIVRPVVRVEWRKEGTSRWQKKHWVLPAYDKPQ